MRYLSTILRFGGGYYYILCCATVNDGKLDEASGYGHSLKPGFLIASFRLLWPYAFVHPADNNYKARCGISVSAYTTKVSQGLLSVCSQRGQSSIRLLR